MIRQGQIRVALDTTNGLLQRLGRLRGTRAIETTPRAWLNYISSVWLHRNKGVFGPTPLR